MKSKNTHGKSTILFVLLIVGVMSLFQNGVAKEIKLTVITSDAPPFIAAYTPSSISSTASSDCIYAIQRFRLSELSASITVVHGLKPVLRTSSISTSSVDQKLCVIIDTT